LGVNGIPQPSTAPLLDNSNRTQTIPGNLAITPMIRLSDANLLSTDLRFGFGASDVFRWTPMQMV